MRVERIRETAPISVGPVDDTTASDVGRSVRPKSRNTGSTADSLEDVVEATGESEAEILRKGVESYVERELRDARGRIEELREEFGVETPGELVTAIERGDVDEHPAWEALIEWENLATRIDRLERR